MQEVNVRVRHPVLSEAQNHEMGRRVRDRVLRQQRAAAARSAAEAKRARRAERNRRVQGCP